jgi:DNA-binding transcriptional LysR family regulator
LRNHDRVNIELLLSDQPIDLVREGIDLAIRVVTPGAGALIQRKLGSVGVALVAARSFVKKHGVPATIQEGDGHRAVLHTGTRQNMADLVTAGVLPAIPAFHVRLVSDDIEAVRDATLAGLGLSPLPIWLVAEHLAAGRLVRVLPKLQVPPSPVFAVFPSGRQHSARLRAFVAQFEADLGVRLEAVEAQFAQASAADAN